MSTSHSVLLDLDGTLIDSQPGIVTSCLAALRALGHKPDEALDVKRFIGAPIEDVMQFLLQSYGDDRVGEAVVAYRQHYGESGLLEVILVGALVALTMTVRKRKPVSRPTTLPRALPVR